MSREVGEYGLIQEFIPEWMAIFFALVTQLGDIWFLSLVIALIYWYQTNQRESIIVIVGTTFTGIVVVNWLKYIFNLPRPGWSIISIKTLPAVIQPLYEATGTGGYGFQVVTLS